MLEESKYLETDICDSPTEQTSRDLKNVRVWGIFANKGAPIKRPDFKPNHKRIKMRRLSMPVTQK